MFPGKLALQQRVLPAYRIPFFDTLAGLCAGGLELLAGQPLPIESISAADPRRARLTNARNRHIFHPRHPLYLCWQDGIVDWLEDIQPDALIIEANPRYLSTYQAITWMHHRNKPIIGWGLGATPLTGTLGVAVSRSRNYFIQQLDGLIAYSQRGADQYRALNMLPPERIFVAHNAVAPPPAAPPARAQPSHPLHLLFVGRLQPRKKLDILFRALAALPEQIQPALTIIGDGPARNSFERAARDSYPRTQFLGALHDEPLAQQFAAADLFVLPGTGGLAVQEAMTHGLPIIVAQGDGTQADLVRPENGWQIPPNDVAALTDALRTALENPTQLRPMGAASYRIVADEININTMAEKFVEALKQAASNKP